MTSQDLITINVGGQRFSTTGSTLRRHPDSRLAQILDGRDPDHKVVSGQIFIDRDWTLFTFILDYLRAGQITLPAEFSDHDKLAGEAEFYGLHVLTHRISRSPRSRAEVLEVRFSVHEAHGTFRVFCSSARTLEALAKRISVFVEHPNLRGPVATPQPVQRTSHHDLLFHCGTDPFARDDFSARFVSIAPDERRLLNGTNVLGLLLDTVLGEGFRLLGARTLSPEDKMECFTFEKRSSTLIAVLNEEPGTEHPREGDGTPTQSKTSKTNRKK